MRTITIAIAVLGLAACSGASSPSLPQTQSTPSFPRSAPHAAAKGGIYVSEFDGSSVYGYAGTNQRNAPPICGETSGDFVADVATDRNGDLIAPSQQGETINIYSGPRMCGPTAATLHDPYGLPVDAASANALTQKIAVANIEGDGPISNPPAGGITICTIAGGCTRNLTNPAMFHVDDVVVLPAPLQRYVVCYPPSIYTVYFTAWTTGDGLVHFRDDIYGLDGQGTVALAQDPSAIGRPEETVQQ